MAPADWQGGDLAGLLGAIQAGSFEDLGVNTLWISSPLANFAGAELDGDGYSYTAYHGYWPRDLDAIDPHLGDRALLAEVVDTAHAHGLRVIVDYVMNHVHDSSPLYAEHPDWFWPNLSPDGQHDCVCGQGCSFDQVPERERCWFRAYLPDFDFQVDAARYWSVSNAVHWARDLGLDGFRLDAIKHVERSWGEDLRSRLHVELEASGQPFYLVGETFTGDRELIKSYIGPTQLDGQFDFPWRAAVVSNVLRGEGTMSELMAFLDGNDTFYAAGTVMSTFLGNHDLPRSVHEAERPPLFNDVWDMGHDRSWTNLPATPTDPDVYQRLAVAYTILLTTPGAPLIYYGDEYGMAGGGDPDNRRMMPRDGWNPEQLALRATVKALLHLRASTPALRRGRRVTRGASGDGAVYALVDGPTKIFVALNRGDDAVPASGLPDGLYTDLLAGTMISAPLMIPPRAALVLAPR
jgi:glycosidase